MSTPRHPAPFHPAVINIAAEELTPLAERKVDMYRVLDPFAGVGGIHELGDRYGGFVTYAVELMPKWATAPLNLAHRSTTFVGSATAMNFREEMFDAVVTSPCYGNRMADHHAAADTCKTCDGDGETVGTKSLGERYVVVCPTCKGTGLSHRRSYKHYYGDGFDEVPAELNAGAMQWGDEYRALHAAAWQEVYRVLKPEGRFLLNIKDHIRDHKRVRVSAWHRRTILDLGFVELGRWDIPTSGYGFGENNGARVPNEYVYVFAKEQ